VAGAGETGKTGAGDWGLGMTKEEWGKVEKALSGTYGYAKLQVDGRAVLFQRQLVSNNQLGIVTFIDGEFKGAWISAKEERPKQKFLRRVERFSWPSKTRAELKKWPKKMLKKSGYDPDEKYHFFSPIWPNATALRRHYLKTFASIELVEVCG